MKRHSKFIMCVALVALLSLLLFVTSFSAEPPQSQPQPSPVFKVPVEYVSVLFTVIDRKNHYVTDLKQTDFSVYEDDKPQNILIFRAETDLPLKIALLIDASTSIAAKLKFEQESAIGFLQSNLRKGKDKALLVTFDSSVEFDQDFTDDMALLSQAIHNMRAGGGTALYDAIYRTCREKLPTPRGDFRNVIILITDGEDNQSEVQSLTKVIEMAQRAEASIYAISTNSSGVPLAIQDSSRKSDKILKEMSDQTGGQAFFPFRAQEFAQSFEGIGRELRSQYNLGYVSTNSARDGRFRTIKIVPNDKHLQAKARRGYFATSTAK